MDRGSLEQMQPRRRRGATPPTGWRGPAALARGLARAALLVLVGCGSGSEAGPEPAAAPVERERLELQVGTLLDRTHGDFVAATFRAPADWQAGGEVVWNYDDVQLPMTARALARSPDGRVWVEAFPTLGFYWLQPPAPDTPRGARVLGMTHLPPMDPAEALMRFVIDPARGDRLGLQVIGLREIPNLAESLGEGGQPGRGIALRVRYEQGGEIMSEEFMANYVRTTGQAGGFVQHNWYLDLVHSMAAPESEFAEWRPLLTAVAVSFEANPAWEQMAAQLRQRLESAFQARIAQGYANIRAAREASRMISQHYDEIRAMQRDSSRLYNETIDRTTQQFSDALRGVDRMQDPLWGQSEQPYEYEYHWTDGNGSYRHSNDPTYDPNTQPGPTWTRMQRVP